MCVCVCVCVCVCARALAHVSKGPTNDLPTPVGFMKLRNTFDYKKKEMVHVLAKCLSSVYYIQK